MVALLTTHAWRHCSPPMVDHARAGEAAAETAALHGVDQPADDEGLHPFATAAHTRTDSATTAHPCAHATANAQPPPHWRHGPKNVQTRATGATTSGSYRGARRQARKDDTSHGGTWNEARDTHRGMEFAAVLHQVAAGSDDADAPGDCWWELRSSADIADNEWMTVAVALSADQVPCGEWRWVLLV